MFRSLLCKSGVDLKRTVINGESSSSSSSSLAPTAKYLLFLFQNPNLVISKSRVTSIFYSFSTTAASDGNLACSDSDSSFVVSYLINSCGLSQDKAITASKKLNFKTTSQPDSVLTLLKSYGFTESHISTLINKFPSILSSNPDKTLKPKFDFFNSKRLCGIDLANYISIDPFILKQSFNKGVIPSFDILETIVHSDLNVIKMMKGSNRLLITSQVKNLMANVELLRNEGVPESNISKFLIQQPRASCEYADRFKETVEKVKEMGFDHLETRFLIAILALTSMTEANWRRKIDVYKTWGWSEDQFRTAFRKYPHCMKVSEKKISAVMNYLVKEMGYDSSIVAENPRVLSCSLKKRFIPRCSVIRILVSKGLINDMISIDTLSKMVDESFLEKFVIKHEEEVPELMKVFQGHLNYHDLL